MGDVVIKGPGNSYYRANRHFAKLPGAHQFGQVRRVAVDSQDRVYVCQRDLLKRDMPPVLVFDSDGNYLTGWGEGVFKGLHGIFITPRDEVFLVDTDRHQVFKCTTEGEILLTLGSGLPAFGDPFNHPSDVAVSETGEIYVADGDGNTRVHKYSKEGVHLLSWGECGKGPGQFTTPHSIRVYGRDRVFVGDRDTGRILEFTSMGEFVNEWTDILFRPTALYIDPQNRLVVTDLICRVNTYDLDGNVISRAHSAAPPHAICGDSKGNLYFAFPDGHPYIEKWERIDQTEASRLAQLAS